MTENENQPGKAQTWLRRHFGSRTLPKQSHEQSLTEHGLGILADHKLEERIAFLVDLEEKITEPITEMDLAEYVAELKKRTEILNHACVQIAMPYARSGSKPEYARRLRGLTKMMSICNLWFAQARAVIGENSTDKSTSENLIHMMGDNITKFVWPDQIFFLGVCFQDADISARAATIVQSMQPMHSAGIDVNQEADKL